MNLRPGELAVKCLECGSVIAKEMGKLLEIKNGSRTVLSAVWGTANIECRHCHHDNVVPFGTMTCPMAGPPATDTSAIPTKC
jgi:hypothetical protein